MNEHEQRGTSNRNYLFVSYAHADAPLVRRDLDALDRAGVNLWYDQALRVGVIWREELAQRIKGSWGVLVFLSKHFTASAHCMNEIGFAIDEGKPLICVYTEPTGLTPGFRMSLAHRQALVRYSIPEDVYLARLVAAARAFTNSSEESEAPETTLLLPEVLLVRYNDHRSMIPADSGSRYWIGRAADCELTIESGFISRHHGFFDVRDGTFQYRDQSRNGSLLRTLDDERIVHGIDVALPDPEN